MPSSLPLLLSQPNLRQRFPMHNTWKAAAADVHLYATAIQPSSLWPFPVLFRINWTHSWQSTSKHILVCKCLPTLDGCLCPISWLRKKHSPKHNPDLFHRVVKSKEEDGRNKKLEGSNFQLVSSFLAQTNDGVSRISNVPYVQ